MGFWSWGKKEYKPKDICIPDARKKASQEKVQKKRVQEQKNKRLNRLLEITEPIDAGIPDFSDSKPRLQVDGLFVVGNTFMLKGTVVSGKIAKSNKLKTRTDSLKVKDIQFHGKSVGSLRSGQKGAVFFEKAAGINFRSGDVIPFS